MKKCKLCDNMIEDKYTVCYECYKDLERLRMKKKEVIIMTCRPDGRNKKKNTGVPANDGSGRKNGGRGRKR